VTGIDHIAAMVMGDLKRFKGQLIRGPEIASADFIKSFHGAVVKGAVGRAGDAASVLNVLTYFLARKKPEGGAVGNTVGDIFNLWMLQHLFQRRLTCQDKAYHQAVIHFKVGKDTEKT
jgi:hypothetical protein